jgi:phosphoribosylaminoimidazolecarboxamide formyltransferase/IMP cyclohydrolase
MGNVLTDTSDGSGFPAWAGATWDKAAVLRYGENPHQRAALFLTPGAGGLAQATQLHGKEMSYNNYVDADAAWRAAHDHDAVTVAVIKHANPCGIAVGQSVAEAHAKAHACDPVSAFGGVIASNSEITADAARQIAEVFTEVVAAPSFAPEALEILKEKKNLRLLTVEGGRGAVEMRPITGGLLLQHSDRIDAQGDDPTTWTLATGKAADDAMLADLLFAWRACRAVKSNAILLAKDGGSVGVGMGQVNRVDSCKLAVDRAGPDRARGAVAASDAFFPFADGLQVVAEAGATAVIQPGGSMRDAEVIAAADAAGLAMVFTGMRHFRH